MRHINEPAAFGGTTFTGTFGLLLLAKYFPVRENQQNLRDRYAVAVKKYAVTIGDLPRKVLRVCSLFVRCLFVSLFTLMQLI